MKQFKQSKGRINYFNTIVDTIKCKKRPAAVTFAGGTTAEGGGPALLGGIDVLLKKEEP